MFMNYSEGSCGKLGSSFITGKGKSEWIFSILIRKNHEENLGLK